MHPHFAEQMLRDNQRQLERKLRADQLLRAPWPAAGPPGRAGAASALLRARRRRARSPRNARRCSGSEGASRRAFVVLTVVPGFDTPSWLLQPQKTNPNGAPSTGAPWHDFDFAYPTSTGGTSTQGSTPRALPYPWNGTYLNDWLDFLLLVAERYGSNPAFRMIEVGGPTSVSTEMSLGDNPTGDAAVKPDPPGDDLTEWIRLKYTPQLDEGAWKSVLQAYSKLFPYQYLSLSLYSGLPIGKNDHLDPAQSVATPLAIIAAARKSYPESLAIQAGGLGESSGISGGPYPFVQANCSAVVTGFQTHGPGKETGPLLDDLERGVQAGADFLEVYAFGDVLNTDGTALDPDDTSALDTVASQLPAGSACAPLTLESSTGSLRNGEVTLTASVAPPVTPADPINIFDGRSPLAATCTNSSTATTCTVSTPAPAVTTTYTADVGAAGTIPFSSQAVLSTSTRVKGSGILPGRSGKPGCKGGSTCH